VTVRRTTANTWFHSGLALAAALVGCRDSDAGHPGADATTADVASTTAGASTHGGDGPDLGVCAAYLECVRAATPDHLPATLDAYGEDGACWQLVGGDEEACWRECEAHRDELAETVPDEQACWRCGSDEDCTEEAAPHCGHFCDWERADELEWICVRERHECVEHTILHCDSDRQALGVCTQQGLPAGNLSCFGPKPGPCPTENAVGSCIFDEPPIPPAPVVLTFYADGDMAWTSNTAETECGRYGGRWNP
jgi:hypothetical protein